MKLIFKLLLGLPVGVTIIDTLGYVARVDGDSMKPTFNPLGNSDYVFLSKFSARNYQVVCNSINHLSIDSKCTITSIISC